MQETRGTAGTNTGAERTQVMPLTRQDKIYNVPFSCDSALKDRKLSGRERKKRKTFASHIFLSLCKTNVKINQQMNEIWWQITGPSASEGTLVRLLPFMGQGSVAGDNTHHEYQKLHLNTVSFSMQSCLLTLGEPGILNMNLQCNSLTAWSLNRHRHFTEFLNALFLLDSENITND